MISCQIWIREYIIIWSNIWKEWVTHALECRFYMIYLFASKCYIGSTCLLNIVKFSYLFNYYIYFESRLLISEITFFYIWDN